MSGKHDHKKFLETWGTSPNQAKKRMALPARPRLAESQRKPPEGG